MATGGPSSWNFQVRWDGSTWVDESAYLSAGGTDGIVEITRGGRSWKPEPSVMTGTLRDPVRHVPDNPLSPLYPNVRDGALTRFTVTTPFGDAYGRHRGEMSTSAPQIADGDPSRCTVAFEVVDSIGRMAGITLRSEFLERWLTSTATRDVSLWAPGQSQANPTDIDNIGNTGIPARIVPHRTRVGTASTVQPDSILLSAAWELKKNDATASGPVIVAGPLPVATVDRDIVIPFRLSDRIKKGKAARTIAQGINGAGAEIWALRLVDNVGQTDMNLYDRGTFAQTMYYSWAPDNDSEVGDDQWFALRIYRVGSGQGVSLYRILDGVTLASNFTSGFDSRLTQRIVVGGNIAGKGVGGQASCVTMQVGAIVVCDGGTPGHIGYLDPRGTEPAASRVTSIGAYTGLPSGYMPSSRMSDDDRVAITDMDGRSALDVATEMALTLGGYWTSMSEVDNTILYYPADRVRTPAVALTIDLEGDAGEAFTRERAVVPSRVAARFPGGELTRTVPGRVRVDETIDVAATDSLQAANAAAFVTASGGSLAVTSITLDLAGASNNLWTAAMSLAIGNRIRLQVGSASISGQVPPLVQHFGQTYVDVWVTGWTERWGEGVAEMTLCTVPADDPVEARWGANPRGRWAATPGSMTVTGGTALSGGAGAAGTVVVTIAGGAPGWSTSSGDYPLDVDWAGEVRTVTTAPSAPSGGMQTLTLAAGAVAPSIARVHASGEPIDVHLPAAYTI